MTNVALIPAQRESVNNCHISNQIQHNPQLPMVEACAQRTVPMIIWSCSFSFSYEVLIRLENLSKYGYREAFRYNTPFIKHVANIVKKDKQLLKIARFFDLFTLFV